MNEDAFRERLARTAAAVEARLDAELAATPREGELARPSRLVDAMRYATLGGGKRLRPFLTVETARALGRADDGPVRAGAAIECLHAYSLVHDDLPSMDDDDLRRGKPTVHRAFDEATAVLVGDALQALAFEILADPQTDANPETRANLCAGLARASGLAGMVGGQMLDLLAETLPPQAPDEIARLQAMKTGALLSFSVEAGALLAAAPAPVGAALRLYGRAIGAAFQIADDLLDAEGDEAALGKRAGKDADRGKATLVSALGIDVARSELERLIAKAKEAIDRAGLGEQGDILREAAEFVGARKN